MDGTEVGVAGNGSPDGNVKARRPYSRPTVRRIHLRPEESVLGTCKSGSINGPNVANRCTIPTNCSASGS